MECEQSKRCTQCGLSRPIEQFAMRRYPNGSERPYSWCRECCRIRVSAWYRKPENRKRKAAAQQARGAQVRRDERERHAQKVGKQYVPRHVIDEMVARRDAAVRIGATIRAWQRWCRADDPYQSRDAYRRRYRNDSAFRQREIERSREGKRSWRADIAGSGISLAYIAELRASATECEYCGRAIGKGTAHVDHIHPRSLGGTSEPDNLAVVCAECNISKAARLLHVWAREQPAHVMRRAEAVLAGA